MVAGPRTLARLRAEGSDPSHGGEAAHKRGQRNAARKREAAEWGATIPEKPDSKVFRRGVLPSLQGVPLSVMMEATGLSLRYCSLIRRGLYVPHPRHWDRLAQIIDRL